MYALYLHQICFAGAESNSNRTTQATRDLSSSNRGRLLNKGFDVSKSMNIV